MVVVSDIVMLDTIGSSQDKSLGSDLGSLEGGLSASLGRDWESVPFSRGDVL